LRTAAPVIPAYILNGPPTIQQVTTMYTGASQEAIAAQFAAAMLEYQMYNTALWDAIEPFLSGSKARTNQWTAFRRRNS
jgi:hypothetical protein